MAGNDVLKATTEIKIHELRRHDGELSRQYDAIDETLERVRGLPVERLRALYEGVDGLQVVQERLHKGLDDLPDLLDFGAVDPDSVGGVLGLRAESIEREIKCRRSLWQHNKLLGALLVETLDDPTGKVKETEPLEDDGEWLADDVGTSSSDDPAPVPLEAQRLDAQKRIEEYFFVPCGLDRQSIRAFLETDVFHRREQYSDDQWTKISNSLAEVRDAVATFCGSFTTNEINATDVAQLAKVLLVDKNEFSREVVQLLENAVQNTVVQQELAHVLTIKLSMLSEFQWPLNGVPVVMKRAMNGRFRSLIQEGAIPFLLFQYIGLSWSIFIKSQLAKLLTCIDFARNAFHQVGSVRAQRIEMRDRFLVAALPDAMDSSSAGDTYDDATDAPTKRANKLDVLRFVCAEAYLTDALAVGENKNARPSVLAVVTDLEFFGPSVSHEVVLGIMAFLGVTESWLRIFETHLKMPIRFPGSDTPQVLAKGVPASRRSSRFYAELVLFTMDFAVMGASGVFLYRNHDDILFFGHDDTPVLQAWDAIHTLTARFGLRLNQDKSGSVRLCCAPRDATDTEETEAETSSYGPEPLPQKPIRWGLIELQRDATVKILEDQVDWFAWELAQKLNTTASSLRWITVYNKYMRFFLRNFGSVSPVFGLGHADSMIQQIKHIHGILFPATRGDVREAMRQKIMANHPELMGQNPAELPAAWVYWPLDLGGLGLFHPLLELWSFKQTLVDDVSNETNSTRPLHGLREKLLQRYEKFVDRADRDGLNEAVAVTFRSAITMFELVQSTTYSERNPPPSSGWSSEWTIDESFAVRPLHEFAARTAEFENHVGRAYSKLLPATSVTDHLSYDDAHTAADDVFGAIDMPHREYWNWVAYVYQRELLAVFGTASLVTSKLLPAQLIGQIKKEGIYWS